MDETAPHVARLPEMFFRFEEAYWVERDHRKRAELLLRLKSLCGGERAPERAGNLGAKDAPFLTKGSALSRR